MGELETLVEAMENDQLPLEELVEHYEKGANLLQHCEQVLSAARKRIELIEVGRSSEKELAPQPDADEAQDPAASSPSGPAEDNDIRLL
jgi:exodeoxyribonuclease VII small subunit